MSDTQQFSFRLPIIILIVTLFAFHGYRKKSLNQSGVIAAWLTGVSTCYFSATFGILLLSFYLSSSYLTKYKSSIKKKIEDGHAVGGQRNYIQVLSNSLPATVWAFIFYNFTNDRSTTIINFSRDYFASFILSAFIGHYSCCNGDTWASELGILSKSEPILITTLKRVPKGTNGGLSLLGTSASIAGGLFIGIMFCLSSSFFNSYYPIEVAEFAIVGQQTFKILLLSTLSGLLGSLIDSLLGALLQLSLYSINRGVVINNTGKLLPTDKTRHISGTDILDNHQVNFLSCAITSILSGFIGSLIFI